MTTAATQIDKATTQVATALEQLKRRLPGAATASSIHLDLSSINHLLSHEIHAAPAFKKVADALRHHDEVMSTALQSAGMPNTVLVLLRSWMSVQMEARSSILQLEVAQWVDEMNTVLAGAPAEVATNATPTRDPMQLLNANEMGQALGGMSDQIVRDREKSRELFSVLKAGRKRGREYPAFQAWEGIVGTPLATVLKALGSMDGAAAYSFFSSRLHELGGLTPVEVLSGGPTHAGRLSHDARAILALAADERLAGVVNAAEAFLADASA